MAKLRFVLVFLDELGIGDVDITLADVGWSTPWP